MSDRKVGESYFGVSGPYGTLTIGRMPGHEHLCLFVKTGTVTQVLAWCRDEEMSNLLAGVWEDTFKWILEGPDDTDDE